MDGARGALADTVRLLASGEPATVVVAASPQSRGGPLFTLRRGDEVVIDESADFTAILQELSVCAVPWAQFTSGSWWGLPPVDAPLFRQPMTWAADTDALGISAVFGLPPVSSNVDALLFLMGCCEPPAGFVSGTWLPLWRSMKCSASFRSRRVARHWTAGSSKQRRDNVHAESRAGSRRRSVGEGTAAACGQGVNGLAST
ncbi:hypothetical protein AB1Y20_017943 [Prymnesium parvum]|uniref:Uncharacterized protein n=1 Tax=Prymnesium parvum TaxID=97485 RepID=A0AB34JN85_PRYPA